jgi:hypothetical protein
MDYVVVMQEFYTLQDLVDYLLGLVQLFYLCAEEL